MLMDDASVPPGRQGPPGHAYRVYKRLIHNDQCTTVYVTHDHWMAMSLADKIAVINFGVLQQYGTPAEVYDDPENEYCGLLHRRPPHEHSGVPPP